MEYFQSLLRNSVASADFMRKSLVFVVRNEVFCRPNHRPRNLYPAQTLKYTTQGHIQGRDSVLHMALSLFTTTYNTRLNDMTHYHDLKFLCSALHGEI